MVKITIVTNVLKKLVGWKTEFWIFIKFIRTMLVNAQVFGVVFGATQENFSENLS